MYLLFVINFLSEFRKKDNGEAILESVSEIFRLRHIYCHEVPLKKNIDIDSIQNGIGSLQKTIGLIQDIGGKK